jgi:hypothetical protein
MDRHTKERKGLVQVKHELEAVLKEGHINKEGELCVQAIFSLLDVLKKFVADLKQKAEEAAGTLLLGVWRGRNCYEADDISDLYWNLSGNSMVSVHLQYYPPISGGGWSRS